MHLRKFVIAIALPEEERSRLVNDISEDASFDAAYVISNVLASVIACYGLLQNSAAVVIGAMLIAMLLGPISGIALSLVQGNGKLLVKSLAAEIGGVLLVLLVSFIIGRIDRFLPFGSQVLSRTTPNILDLIIALAGGSAGAYATISPKLRAGLVGVAVATALVPPLAVCGLCLARGANSLAWGGFLLFFANFIAIQFAFSVVLSIFGFYKTHYDESVSRQNALARHVVSVALLVILAFVLGRNFSQTVGRQQHEAAVRSSLIQGLKAYPGADLADLQFSGDARFLHVTAVVRATGAVSPVKVGVLQSKLPLLKGQDVELRVRTVITKTANAHGYLEESNDSQPVGGTTPTSTDTDSAPSDAGQ